MMAGCDNVPPASVTMAPAEGNSTDHEGLADAHTRTSPARSLPNSASEPITFTLPQYRPDAPAIPTSAFVSASRWLSSGAITCLANHIIASMLMRRSARSQRADGGGPGFLP